MPDVALPANLKRCVGSPLGVKVDLKSLRMAQQFSVWILSARHATSHQLRGPMVEEAST